MVNRVWHKATMAISVMMCIAAAAMACEIAIYSDDADESTIGRFAIVAAIPFAWILVARALHRKHVDPAMIFGLTALVFIVFGGAVDFANGRPLYSWITALVG